MPPMVFVLNVLMAILLMRESVRKVLFRIVQSIVIRTNVSNAIMDIFYLIIKSA